MCRQKETLMISGTDEVNEGKITSYSIYSTSCTASVVFLDMLCILSKEGVPFFGVSILKCSLNIYTVLLRYKHDKG